MEDKKNQILEILRTNLREDEGKEDLLYYLEKGTDFFTAPSSTVFHSSEEGGLALHSLHVYELLKEKNDRYGLNIPPASIAVCGLLHDICKTNYYVREKKWRKVDGKWVEEEVWVVDDKFPSGHGEKSVFVIQRFIKLTDDEIIAIRWHMAAFDAGIHFNYPSGYPFRLATKRVPLLTTLITADMEASNILEADDYNPNHKMKGA